MRLPTFVMACALTTILTGCASSAGLRPSGQALDATALHSERSLAGAPLTPAAWPAKDWWTALGDPQLDALVAEALHNNPDMAAADARARAAQAQASGADAARSPSLNASASISGAHLPRTLIPAPLGGHFSWVKYGYLSFKWDLDLWGGQRAAWEAAVDQVHAAEVDAHAARIMVSVDVARAYAHLGYAFDQQDIAHDELKRAGKVHQLTDQRVHAGIDSKLQLKQSDAEAAAAEQQVAAAQRQVDSARVALSVLLGKGPDRGLKIARPHTLTLARLALPANLPAELLGRRPDLVAARWRVESAGRDIKTAKAAFLPNISLGALAGLAAGGGTSLFQLPARFYQVAPAISLPIFNGGNLRANLAGKDAQYDFAVAQYNKTLIGALNQIANDFAGLTSLTQQVAAQQRALDAAQQAWTLAEQRYKAGVGNYLQALNVRQQLLRSEQAAAGLRAQQLDLSVQLIEALGGGYQPPPAKTASAVPEHHTLRDRS